MFRSWNALGLAMHHSAISYRPRTWQEVDVLAPEGMWFDAAAAVQSQIEGEVVADAREILVAEQGRLRLADRLRPGCRLRVVLTTGTAVVGVVLEATDALVDLVDPDGWAHLLWRAGLATVEGVPGGLAPGEAVEAPVCRTSWGTVMRQVEGEAVEVELVTGQVVAGWVGAVGADHLDVLVASGTVTVPVTALVRLRRRHRMDAC